MGVIMFLVQKTMQATKGVRIQSSGGELDPWRVIQACGCSMQRPSDC